MRGGGGWGGGGGGGDTRIVQRNTCIFSYQQENKIPCYCQYITGVPFIITQ